MLAVTPSAANRGDILRVDHVQVGDLMVGGGIAAGSNRGGQSVEAFADRAITHRMHVNVEVVARQ